MTYTAPKPHKDGGYVCQHSHCGKQATVMTEERCDDGAGCKQARAEIDANFDRSSFDHIPDTDARSQAQTEWRRTLEQHAAEHGHPVYACQAHAEGG